MALVMAININATTYVNTSQTIVCRLGYIVAIEVIRQIFRLEMSISQAQSRRHSPPRSPSGRYPAVRFLLGWAIVLDFYESWTGVTRKVRSNFYAECVRNC